jgi:polar amino acid transport system permease protein
VATLTWRPNRLDGALLVLLAVFLAWAGWRLRAGLDYAWHWEVIPQYLLRRDPETGWQAGLLLNGLLTTLKLSLWTMLLATPLGFAMGLLRVSPRPFRQYLGQSYVGLVRNLPPLVLIFIFYFFVSGQLLPLIGLDAALRAAPAGVLSAVGFLFVPPERLPQFLSALVTLALFEGAYLTEIVRAGVRSIEIGQWEAAAALGLTRGQTLRRVVLPQALQRIVPPLAGQFVSTITDSAIVSVISIQELTFQGLELMAATYLTLEVWIVVTGLYLLLTLSCSRLLARLELRLRRSLA